MVLDSVNGDNFTKCFYERLFEAVIAFVACFNSRNKILLPMHEPKNVNIYVNHIQAFCEWLVFACPNFTPILNMAMEEINTLIRLKVLLYW